MTALQNGFYLDISRVLLAHEFVLDNERRCDYSEGRRSFGFSYALSGVAEYKFPSGKRYTVRPGDAVFLPADAAYTIATVGSYRHYTVNFLIHEEGSRLPFRISELLIRRGTDAGQYQTAFCTLTELWNKKTAGYEMRAAAILYEMLADFLAQESLHHTGGALYRRILPAKEYVEEHPTSAYSLASLAALCNMSETNFRRCFRTVMGEAPMQYRDRLRLGIAKEYLASGIYSVTRVAELCGFEDVSYFCRFFKKRLGISPLKFRE